MTASASAWMCSTTVPTPLGGVRSHHENPSWNGNQRVLTTTRSRRCQRATFRPRQAASAEHRRDVTTTAVVRHLRRDGRDSRRRCAAARVPLVGRPRGPARTEAQPARQLARSLPGASRGCASVSRERPAELTRGSKSKGSSADLPVGRCAMESSSESPEPQEAARLLAIANCGSYGCDFRNCERLHCRLGRGCHSRELH